MPVHDLGDRKLLAIRKIHDLRAARHVFLRSPGWLPGITFQAGANCGRQGASVASLLLVLALPLRPIPHGC